MKLLENIFLILTIFLPIIFIIWSLFKFDKVKNSKKFRTAMVLLILSSFLINGCIFGAIKMHNEKNLKDVTEPNGSSPNTFSPTENPSNPSSSGTTNANTTSKGFSIELKDGVTYIDGVMIANKTYPLPKEYVPTNTHKSVGSSHNCQECLIKEAYDAYAKMKSDASANGLTLWIASGYRSYTYQNGLYQSYAKRNGKKSADTYSARPGHSEHQTGYAFDLNTVSSSFADTKEGKWVNENCSKYGFILRYPKGKENKTGYIYEPWHLRYVGTELSAKLYNSDGTWTTMEEYFGITSQYIE